MTALSSNRWWRMVLLAAHAALPRPERVPRLPDSLEARLNATNDALQPSAGGVVEFWSDPIGRFVIRVSACTIRIRMCSNYTWLVPRFEYFCC